MIYPDGEPYDIGAAILHALREAGWIEPEQETQ